MTISPNGLRSTSFGPNAEMGMGQINQMNNSPYSISFNIIVVLGFLYPYEENY